MKHYLAVAACIKTNFPENIIQWYLWNKFIGVDHFYIVDDGSDIPVCDILKDHLDDVTILRNVSDKSQYGLYTELYKKYKSECHWMAFIDDDEFIYMSKIETGDRDAFTQFLKTIEHKNCLELQWRQFGPEGRQKQEDYKTKLILSTFRYWRPCHFVKSIVNCAQVVHLDHTNRNVHRLVHTGAVNCFGQDIPAWEDTKQTSSDFLEKERKNTHHDIYYEAPVSIHHYSIKSLEELTYKLYNRGFKQGEYMAEHNTVPEETPLKYRCEKLVKQLLPFTNPRLMVGGYFPSFVFRKKIKTRFLEFCKSMGHTYKN